VRNQVWVDSIRAINFEMFRQAVDVKRFTFPVGTRTAYVLDPEVVTSKDGEGYEREEGETLPQKPYSVSRMRFFTDLNSTPSKDLTAVRVPGRARPAGEARRLPDGRARGRRDAGEGLAQRLGRSAQGVRPARRQPRRDRRAAPVLAELGLVDAEDVAVDEKYVGYVDFGDRALPLNQGLRGVASQTYDTVPIGYQFGQVTAPNWTVDSAAWEAGGGVTAGTNGDGRTVYGEKPSARARSASWARCCRSPPRSTTTRTACRATP
jgi:hypothetical protein